MTEADFAEISNKKARAWFLTTNNPTAEEVAMPAMPNEVFCQWQKEVGAECGTPHIHAVIYMKNAVHFNAVKKKYPRANISKVRNLPKAIEYCRKEETRVEGPWSRGEEPQQGKRTELMDAIETIKEEVDAGASRPLKRCAEEHPGAFVKFHRGFAALVNELTPHRNEVPEVRVYIGKAGLGKSKWSRAWLEDENAWAWNEGMGNWFDGYLGGKTALFEEFRGQIPYPSLLSALDRYTHRHQVKCGMCSFVATKIAITSPVPPNKWYPRQFTKEDSIRQLLRRITKVYVFTAEDVFHEVDPFTYMDDE
jgi:hypothetical protein